MCDVITAPGGRRRLDEVLDAQFVHDIADLQLEALRDRRDVAAQEETDLSYLRRLLHARIDIVLAEQRRRSTGDTDSVVDHLAAILADDAVGTRGRHQQVEPSQGQRDVDALLTDVGLSDVAALSDEELAASLASFRAEEAAVSARRRDVQHVMDTLNAEIAHRYSTGTASVDDLLAAQREPSD